MEIINKSIDRGKAFDFGRVSADYAKYRDIYPKEFYDKIVGRNLCVGGQRVLDLGTGTGVLPRNMYHHGAKWVGVDISENQIKEAKKLSDGMDIDYFYAPVEDVDFPDNSFDVITACQCFWYFDHSRLMPELHRMLKPDGSVLVLYMAWLPHLDKIAGASEELVLRFSPDWSGAKETIRPIEIPRCYKDKFELVYHEEYPLYVHFTREGWHGRVKACRGVGASLSKSELDLWEKEHKRLLGEIVDDEFDVLHYAAIAELRKKKQSGEQILWSSTVF